MYGYDVQWQVLNILLLSTKNWSNLSRSVKNSGADGMLTSTFCFNFINTFLKSLFSFRCFVYFINSFTSLDFINFFVRFPKIQENSYLSVCMYGCIYIYTSSMLIFIAYIHFHPTLTCFIYRMMLPETWPLEYETGHICCGHSLNFWTLLLYLRYKFLASSIL